ncbi:MAG TPA: NUDIX domain-containing protein [Herpetosiphonaceae bacterium]|nr:NUDIX domain-containing protein [Herpetosiphonaceae bacterium]
MDDWLGAGLPGFGERRAGVAYRVRPGAYAIIADGAGLVAALATPRGFFLPGGGCAAAESPAAALAREVREECGAAIAGVELLGRAIEWFYADQERQHFEIRSHFFRASFAAAPAPGGEDDHALVWLAPASAIERLRRPAQRWAVAQFALPADAER